MHASVGAGFTKFIANMPIQRTLLLLLFAILPGIACAAGSADLRVAKLTGVSPEDHRFADLQAFGDAVGDAQVVVLGEQTHGEGDIFSLKVRLVEYLHEKKGFDVLLLESGLFDGETIERQSIAGASVLQQAPDNLFFAYSKTKEARAMFAYIDAERKSGVPLELATFDSQESGKLSQTMLVDSLGAYLTASGSVLPQSDEWKLFHERTEAILKFDRSEPPAAVQDAYFRFVGQIGQCLNVVDKPESQAQAPYWRRVVASVQSQARRFWTTNGNIVADIDLREAAGADNIVWQIQQAHPGHKFIVWTHDVHGQKSPLFGNIKGSMQRVREMLPQTHFYHVYFTSYSGQFVNYETGALVDVGKPGAQSLEAQLHRAGVKLGFVDLRSASPALRATPLNGHDREFPANHPVLADFTDGVFYIDTLHPTVREKGFED